MKFLSKVKAWFIAHKPTKRRLIQIYAALLYNANIKGFISGKIYTGNTKKACVPGLNCYSCPGAVGACPLGALQDSLAQSGATAPAYILGILILFGLMLGRLICGFLCPFGLVQELLYKIRTPKLRKSRFTRILSYFKYVILAAVIAIPIIYSGIPAFCKYVCPAGTLGGAVSLLANPGNSSFFDMLGYLFTWKFCVAVVVIVASVFIYRFLCRFICPLGAIYSFFNRISLLGVKLDKNKCIDCGLCVQHCKMDIRRVGDHECIMCGECIPVCPVKAISWKGSQLFVHPTSPLAQPAVAEGEKVDLLNLSSNSTDLTPPLKEEATLKLTSLPAETAYESTAPAEKAINEQPAEQLTETAQPAEEQPAEQTAEAQPEKQTEEEQPEKTTKSGRGEAIKAAFKKPRFVVEFVAWIVALCVLIAALVGYALHDEGKVVVAKEGEKCPTFVLDTYRSQGELTEFATVNCRGRVTVINYWYTTCDPCKAELPEFEKVYEELYDEIYMIAVHSYNVTEDVQNWLDNNADKNGRAWSTYKINFAQDTAELKTFNMLGGRYAYPMTVVVDADGKITQVIQGNCSEDNLRAAINNARK